MIRPAPKWLRILAWWGVGIWASAIWILSSMTPPQIEEFAPFQMWDKAAHFSAFLAGGVNLTLALCWSTGWPWKRVVVFTSVALCLFGAVDEIHQLYTPNRFGADVFDWSADTLGALTGALLTVLVYARYFCPPLPAPARA
jgi:VanZ family protein